MIGGGIVCVVWVYDDDIDIDYYVCCLVLFLLGWVCDLFELILRLYISLFDCYCLLWELYVVEGLNDGWFVMYIKMYYVLIDGVLVMKLV